MLGILKKIVGTAQQRRIKHYWRQVAKINEWDAQYESLSDDELRAKTDEFRKRHAEGESLDTLLPEAYAVVKSACRRLIGTDIHVSGYDQKWDMVPYDVQLVGAIAMHDGTIAEMQTGEGKTVTATLPLYLNALSGKPVHLVTVNDYLASRDCQWTGCVLRWLGLTTAPLTNETPLDKRLETYRADVVYGTASEFGFDYLRDNSMVFQAKDQVQRGYHFAIVDEIDSVLIDEARTPLIISGPVPVSRQMYDSLKSGVSAVVRKQRDVCNHIATEARRTLDGLDLLEEGAFEKARLNKGQKKEMEEAFRSLWLVNQGLPRHKVLKRIFENPDLRLEIDNLDSFFHGDQNKEERSKLIGELLIIVDERANEYELTDKGIAAWEEVGEGTAEDFVMFDLGHEYALIDADTSLDEDGKMKAKLDSQEQDAHRKERAHNIRQLLRGQLLMERDIDYMVQDDKVVIIDEHTGRPQPGRRFSDGLHQAIEAKEGVAIQKETQTYATVTLQNYFRAYDKLAGMTGTATTEAGEFKEIYKLEVLEIPTYKDNQRKDQDDQIYMTEREKYAALLKKVRDVHEKGAPILIGTESLDISEKLARIFRQNNLNHTILNAKYHKQEAEIIANAGQKGAITIATNMAGRGTDIKLAPGVDALGGLHVIGASRHPSRRIDRQLRGRCARLGDPGNSIFYISFEDSLMRLFASPRINALLKRLRPPEGEPISAGILNRSIETAQKRVEQRNYTIRKHTLEYDDVMNTQRQEIYAFRNELLHSEEIGTMTEELLSAVCDIIAADYLTDRKNWDLDGYRHWIMDHFPVTITAEELPTNLSMDQVVDRVVDRVIEAFHQKTHLERQRGGSATKDGQIKPAPPEVISDAIRRLMLRALDKNWQEHLLLMDYLRNEVGLRTVAQKDPLLEFKHEAFKLFEEMSHDLRTKIAKEVFRFQIVPYNRQEVEKMLSSMQMEKQRSMIPGDQPSLVDQTLLQKPKPQPVIAGPKINRNDLCPCGSGKKYKKCCELVTE